MSPQKPTQTQSKAVATVTPYEKTLATIDHKAKDFAAQLPAHIPSEKFVRVVKNALAMDPKLAETDTRTLLLECSKAAADGLIIDNREATLTIYNVNKREQKAGKWVDNWQKVAKYIPMYAGLIKRARNTGEILSWQANVFHAKELEIDSELGRPRFQYTAGDDAKIIHDPIVTGDRGPVAGAYSIVRLKNGVVERLVMTIEELRRIEGRTKSRKKVYENGRDTGKTEITGPWATDFEEMCKKTVIRRHSKTLPMSSDLANVFSRDDDMYEPEDTTATIIPQKKRGVAASRVGQTPSEPEIIEGEAVEITTDNDENPAPQGAEQNNEAGNADDQRDPI